MYVGCVLKFLQPNSSVRILRVKNLTGFTKTIKFTCFLYVTYTLRGMELVSVMYYFVTTPVLYRVYVLADGTIVCKSVDTTLCSGRVSGIPPVVVKL